jgi:hypothetical protein
MHEVATLMPRASLIELRKGVHRTDERSMDGHATGSDTVLVEHDLAGAPFE